MEVEAVRNDTVLFHWPREVASIETFCEAVMNGKIRDWEIGQ